MNNLNKTGLKAICKKYKIKKLSLFGSAIKDKYSDKSDIDLLVEFISGGKPGYLTLSKIERELSVIYGGGKVDLRTFEEISRYFSDSDISSAVVQYTK